MKGVFILFFISWVKAIPFQKRSTGVNIHVNSANDFCSYLPPHPGELVSATENNADPFCSNKTKDASVFPTGFIQSAHFVRTETYVQVTGRMDHKKYNILTDDGGGQYDNKNLPNGTCNGLKHWVNLLEPDSDTYCIRCCSFKVDCNIGISTKGCQRIVPGRYD